MPGRNPRYVNLFNGKSKWKTFRYERYGHHNNTEGRDPSSPIIKEARKSFIFQPVGR